FHIFPSTICLSSFCLCRRNGFRDIRRFKSQSFKHLLAALKPRQISSDESVAQQIPERRQNIRRGAAGSAGEGDQRAKLVTRLILENRRGKTDQRLPEELEH